MNNLCQSELVLMDDHGMLAGRWVQLWMWMPENGEPASFPPPGLVAASGLGHVGRSGVEPGNDDVEARSIWINVVCVLSMLCKLNFNAVQFCPAHG